MNEWVSGKVNRKIWYQTSRETSNYDCKKIMKLTFRGVCPALANRGIVGCVCVILGVEGRCHVETCDLFIKLCKCKIKIHPRVPKYPRFQDLKSLSSLSHFNTQPTSLVTPSP